ncbi:hypothetical protein ATB98_21470 [Sinorhizobium saheli]|uniref:Uncharacterized protein n=1 Tax=Sinorhizobium saheli TaxID=36856 RepID=A0A178XYA8_SINSA|nr:hypothetical protein ATB98_21470 [Sinorhizobium saheli]
MFLFNVSLQAAETTSESDQWNAKDSVEEFLATQSEMAAVANETLIFQATYSPRWQAVYPHTTQLKRQII